MGAPYLKVSGGLMEETLHGQSCLYVVLISNSLSLILNERKLARRDSTVVRNFGGLAQARIHNQI